MSTDETAASCTPAHATVYGDPTAEHVLDLFEDMRCSYCADLEHDLGATITGLADQGVYRVRYQVANFLDRGDENGPSTSALAALGAAARQGSAQFAALRSALLGYRRENGSAGLANQDTLIDIVERTPGLDAAALRADLLADTCRPWALEAGAASLAELKATWAAAEAEGNAGTPAAFLDGVFVELFTPDDKPISPSEYTAGIEAILGA
jgi:protein-disulfide isomerase